MGDILEKFIGSPEEKVASDYATVDFRSDSVGNAKGGPAGLRFATIRTQQHLLQVKDAVFAGDVVVTEIDRNPKGGLSKDRILDDLSAAVEELGGDIARRDSGTYVVTPRGVALYRETIGPS